MSKQKRNIIYSKSSLIVGIVALILAGIIFYISTLNADVPKGNDMFGVNVGQDFFHTYLCHVLLVSVSGVVCFVGVSSIIHAFFGFYIDTMRKSVREHNEELEQKEFHLRKKKD